MPSRNSINKPKDTMRQAHKRSQLASKRNARARNGLTAPARSAETSTSGRPKSTAVALYTGSTPTGTITTNTLSKKRLHKIERNKKYVAKRKELQNKLLIDATAKAEEDMDIDTEDNESVTSSAASKKEKPSSKINSVKDALWSVIEDRAADSLIVDSTGEGTTLGGPSFF